MLRFPNATQVLLDGSGFKKVTKKEKTEARNSAIKQRLGNIKKDSSALTGR
jgi:hypothetical protein